MSKTKEQKEQIEENCANCKYFDKFEVQKKENNVLGACKCNPPLPAHDGATSTLGVWPLVLGTFWCGMFDGERK